LRNSLAGAWRYDLQGNPVGAVTRKEDVNACMRLAAVKKKLAAWKAEKEAKKRAAEEAATPKRLGLADLKFEAAGKEQSWSQGPVQVGVAVSIIWAGETSTPGAHTAAPLQWRSMTP
jgi:sRNA-binding protein